MTHQFLKKISIITIISALTFGSLTNFVRAKEKAKTDDKQSDSIVMTVSPAKLKLELKAGQKTDGSFKVINSGKDDFIAKVEAKPYSVASNDYKSINTSEEKKFNQISRWINFDQTEYYLKPNQQKTIYFTVNTPLDIPDGSQYAVIMTSALPKEKDNKKANLTFVSRLGTLVYAKTDGKTREKGSVDQIKIPFVQTDSKLKINYLVKNDGNVDFENKAMIKIKDVFGNTKYSKEILNDILPNTKRKILAEWNKAPAIGLFKLEIENELLNIKSNHQQYILFLNPIMTIATILIISALVIGLIYIKKNK